MKQPNIRFCSATEEIIYGLNLKHRFSYEHKSKSIELPYKYEGKLNKFWLIDSLVHEYLHYILHEFESIDTSRQLDNLGYNDSNGCINKHKYRIRTKQNLL